MEDEQYLPGEAPLSKALSMRDEEQRLAALYQVFLQYGDMDFEDYLSSKTAEEFRDYVKRLRTEEEAG